MHDSIPSSSQQALNISWTILRPCSGFHDLELVSTRAGFDVRSDGNGLQDLCALLLGKRVKRVQKRRATAATVSRDVAIKLAPLWIEDACQSSATQQSPLPTVPLHTLSEHDIMQLPHVSSDSETKVATTAAEAKNCVKEILAGLWARGGNMSHLVVGFDVEFVAAGALARKAPRPQLQLPTVIQVRPSGALGSWLTQRAVLLLRTLSN